jgi:hypothetical protein
MQVEPHPARRRIAALKSDISTLGGEVDLHKAKTARAMGAGVFLLLLAGGGVYDIVNHNVSISTAAGMSFETFTNIVIAAGCVGAGLLVLAVVWQVRRDRSREERLEQLELELADVLDQERERALSEATPH